MNTVTKPTLLRDLPIVFAPQIDSELEVEDGRLESLDWSGQTADRVGLSGVLVTKGDFTSAALPKAVLRDTRFEKCQFAGAVLDEAGLNRLELVDAQSAGLTITNASIKDVLFKGCRLNLANFRFSHFARVTFEDCVLTEADFAYAQLEHVSFRGCDLTGAQFSNVKLSHVDLRTSDISGLNGVAGLKGASIDGLQLQSINHALAAELGIEVVG